MVRFDPSSIFRVLRDPLTAAGLFVDLAPIIAVIGFGWGAAPLVQLYWFENVVIGAFVLLRMGLASTRESPIGAAKMLFVGPFFIVHYGMFCFIHGQFVNIFAAMSEGYDSADFLGPIGLINAAISSAPGAQMFAAMIVAWQAIAVLADAVFTSPMAIRTVDQEMMAPYGRVIVLHIGIFAGAFAMTALGEPMIGVLALIGLKAAWGLFLASRRRSASARSAA